MLSLLGIYLKAFRVVFVTANEVDRALTAPLKEVGAKLLALREDQWLDRKSIRSQPKDLAQHIVAFANAEGGTIVVGLHDGVVEGIDQHGEKINSIRQIPIDFTVPPVRVHVDQVGCINSKGEPDALVTITIDPSESVHELTNGDCYLRVGDESRKLRHDQRRELEFDKGQAQYDGIALAGVDVNDLDPELTRQYREPERSNGFQYFAGR